ncbi:MAG: hypothetical protein NWQ29_02330, partial [Alphaproteobacteria bacterium]|nr:hypothetical protein [Alphaproteobacteria bacterium]
QLFYDTICLDDLKGLKTKLKPSSSFRIKSTEQLSALIRMAKSNHQYVFEMSKNVINLMMPFGTSADAAHFLSLGAILPDEERNFRSFIKNINSVFRKGHDSTRELSAGNLDRCIQLFKKYKDVDVANSFMSNVGIEPRQLRPENAQTNFSHVLTLYEVMFKLNEKINEKINEKDMFRKVIEVIKKPGIRSDLIDIVAFANEINQHANIDELIFKIHNIAELEIFDKNKLVTESSQMTLERSVRLNKIVRSFKKIYSHIPKNFTDSLFTICDSEKYSMDDLEILSVVATHHKVSDTFSQSNAERFLERIQCLPAVPLETIEDIALLTEHRGIDMFFNLVPYHHNIDTVISLFSFYLNDKKASEQLWGTFLPVLKKRSICPDMSVQTAFAAASDLSGKELTSARSKKAGVFDVVPERHNFSAA